jgi:ribose transport system permease protein
MTSPTDTAAPPARPLRTLGARLAPNPALVLLVVACVVFGALEPRFLSAYNVANIAEQSSALGLMTVGLAVVLLLGGIDLSIPAVMASAAVVGAIVMVATQNPYAGALAMVGVGLLGGAVNGLAVAVLGLVPFAVTLATMTLAGGFAVWMTDGTSIYGMPYQFSLTVMSRVGGVPVGAVAFAVVALGLHWAIRTGMIGRWVFAIGTNRRTARICGVPIRTVELGAYVFAGLTAGLAAILLTARLDSAAAAMGSESVVLDVVAAAVIGGVSIYGGRGTILGAAIGAVFITVVGNGLNLLGFDYFTAIVIKGAIILFAISLDSVVTRLSRSAGA